MGLVGLRPELSYIWYGPALFVADLHGGAGEQEPLCGFYFRETRYLRELRLEVNGERPWVCATGRPSPRELLVGLVYPEMAGGGGGGSGTAGEQVETNALGIPRRAVDLMLRYRLGLHALEAELVATNRSRTPVELAIGWCIRADYADLQEAHAGSREQEAAVEPIRVEASAGGARVRYRYGMAELPLETSVEASGAGTWEAAPGRLTARVTLAPQAPMRLVLRVVAHDTERMPADPGLAEREALLDGWRRRLTRAKAPGGSAFARMVNQAMDDLGSFALLEGDPAGWLAPMAGLPLYPALFGRDAITTAWQAASLDRGEQLDATLTRLARFQGSAVDPTRDEQPGRIIHSHRAGPLARLRRNPFGRYYADFSSPFMFVISLAQLYAWTGERRCLDRHWETASRILDWAREYGDLDGDGYLEYRTRAEAGPKNQGWKDSGDAVVDERGDQVPAPLATCEMQGYWFAAQQLFAVLCAARGELGDARAWWRSAQELKARFNRDWWAPEEGCIGFAMGPDKRLIGSPSSNAGQCLATGIVSEEHLRPTVARLFAPDMFSGWGIRTLGTGHPAYNPVSYHLGSVWSVENATIALGLRRFGFDRHALELLEGIVGLAGLYDDGRIPECVGGYARDEWAHPSAYPRANIPQAWNQSALPLLLQTTLGLQPVAPLGLLVIDPVLPWWLPSLTLEGLRVGGATVTMRFWRDRRGRSHGEVVRRRGTLRVVRQPPPESLSAGPLDRFTAFVDGLRHG